MEIDLYQIDAFAGRVFAGNPAAVCPLQAWLPDPVLQSIAQENNLSETAFFVPEGDQYHIRWFTPVSEVDLCGHATLAAAYALFELLDIRKETLSFTSRSGVLTVTRDRNMLRMDFPSQPPSICVPPQVLIEAFSHYPKEYLCAEDYIVVFEHENDVLSAIPDLGLLKKLDRRGVIITAGSDKYDFVARFFAPKYGINEDPVTGSAYTQLVPYWANKTTKSQFHVRQLSVRGGDVHCELLRDRVVIAGQCILYLQGKIFIAVENT
jgi:predicted PhzF superfamily epimerase YddE/YHI9